MDEIYADIEKSKLIGQNALELGRSHFSHLAYVDKIKELNLRSLSCDIF